jgi:aldose sugar dehydrogenase
MQFLIIKSKPSMIPARYDYYFLKHPTGPYNRIFVIKHIFFEKYFKQNPLEFYLYENQMCKVMKKTSLQSISLYSLTLVFLLLIPGFNGINHKEAVDTDLKVIESMVRSEEANFKIVRVVDGLEHPWAISWLPDGRMMVTERPGRIKLIDGESVNELNNLPPIHYQEDQRTAPEGGSQAGLLDLVVHPDYENNGWIYFTYSSPGDDDGVPEEDEGTGTALARARINEEGTDLTDLEVLYTLIPRTVPGRHYGSRILFPGDGTVIFSIGDRGLRYPSQDLTNPAGSMIRLYEDGGAVEDNPFVGMAPGNLRPEIYSFGHRNNQGLAQCPNTGSIFASEHGPYGGDMLHKIENGNNYGWPQVSFGVEYSTQEKIGIGTEAPGVTPPVYVWDVTIAPSGLAFYSGDKFKAWDGNLFAGSLYRKELHRLVMENDEVVHKEVLFSEKIGRIRDVREGPDGYIYIATDEGDGGVYRLEPAD